MVRLVKGAYWDTEIKRAQVDGLAGYPVFTRKVHTDVAYLACAKAMLAAPDAIYPQFASHNAFTIAAIHTLAGDGDYEFQCLHGMGESLYDQVVGPERWSSACRIYAPVGSHETLLAYLVRRLLENGANTSFVNRIVDPTVNIAELVADPVARAPRDRRHAASAHSAAGRALPRPQELAGHRFFRRKRRCARSTPTSARVPAQFEAAPMLGDAVAATSRERLAITNPCDRRDVVGTVIEATRRRCRAGGRPGG